MAFANCRCQHCDGGVEFEISRAGESVVCPHCQMETVLFVPPAGSTPPELVQKPAPKKTPSLPKTKSPFKVLWQLTCGVLLLITVALAVLVVAEHRQLQRTKSALQMTESELAEFRTNVQKAIAADDQKTEQKSHIEAVCGIYNADVPGKSQMDLRSDGTAFYYYQNGQPAGKTRWTLSGDAVMVGVSKFTPEQSDLIDSRGNRWIHVR